MIPTPEEILPLVVPAVPALRAALRRGIDYADDLQPDPIGRDPWYWSHSARFRASRELLSAEATNWSVMPSVPNCGIHLSVDRLHAVRVLRSFGGTTPHPGSNHRRMDAWHGVQGQFPLDRDGSLPPLSLIIDWRDRDGEPELHLGLPSGAWSFLSPTRLHWRVELPEDGLALSELAFNPEPDAGEELLLHIDPAERASSE